MNESASERKACEQGQWQAALGTIQLPKSLTEVEISHFLTAIYLHTQGIIKLLTCSTRWLHKPSMHTKCLWSGTSSALCPRHGHMHFSSVERVKVGGNSQHGSSTESLIFFFDFACRDARLRVLAQWSPTALDPSMVDLQVIWGKGRCRRETSGLHLCLFCSH